MSSSQISSCNSLNQPLCGTAANNDTSKDTSTRQIQKALQTGVLSALGASGAPGVRGIAAALRDLLANADPGAPDPVPSLLETVNNALDTAAKKLADQGVDQKTIDAAIKRFRADLAREIDSLAPASSPDSAPAPAAPATTTSAAAVHAVTKEKFSLNILTAEGDRVSIRFRTSNVTDLAAAQTSDGISTATATETHVISRGRLKIEVQGDLNDDELKAIGDLLDQVDGIAKDFFGGDVQAAFGAAARVSFDTQELSGFNLKLSYSQRIGFASTYGSSSLPVPAPAVPSAPVPVESNPISLPPATQGSSATGAAAAVPVEDAPVSTPAPADAAPVDSATPAAPVPTTTAQQTISSFAKDVLAKLAQVSDAGSVRFTARWKVDFLLTALSAVTPANDTATTDATKALGSSLDNSLGDTVAS